ncbi:MAG TPA: hypothetical protein PLB38_01535 [bacterium]|nr:hypothetical protein [bacterium]
MFNWKKGVALMSVVAGVVLLSACNLFLTDNQIVQKMMERSAQIKSSTMDATIKSSMDSEIGGGEFSLRAKGRYAMENMNDTDNLHYVYDYNLALTASSTGATFTADADVIQTEKQMFFKLNSVPLIPIADLEGYKGQWYSLDFAKMMEMSGAEASFDMNKLTGMSMEMNKLLAESNFLKVSDDLGKTKVGENRVYHYQVSLEKEALKSLMLQMTEKLAVTAGEDVAFDETMKTEMKAALDRSLEMLNITNIEVFIDTKTFDLRRMVFEADLVPPAELALAQTVKISVDMTMDNFNTIKIEDISVPTETIDIFEKYMEEKTKMMELEAQTDELEISDEELFGDIESDSIYFDDELTQ